MQCEPFAAGHYTPTVWCGQVCRAADRSGQKNSLPGPDANKKHPEKDAETDDPDSQHSPDTEFKLDALLFFLFTSRHVSPVTDHGATTHLELQRKICK
jgi:hypothetical protein